MASTAPSNITDLDAAPTASLSTKNIVITGATGLIGRALVARLRTSDANLSLLVRSPPRARSLFLSSATPSSCSPGVLRYNAATPTLSSEVRAALQSADVVVNLAGEPVDEGRWTAERKDALWYSRVRGTEKIVGALREAGSCAVLVNASAVGFYGASETATFTEESGPGEDFLARLASAWEQAALQGREKRGRTVVLRIGVVLAKGGGALEKMSVAFRAFLGGAPGGGTQWFSWVHVDDLVRLIVCACAEEKWEGVYNATAPRPVRLGEFCGELGRAMGRPSWLPVPGGAVRAMMGNEAAALILKGQRVLPKRVQENGFIYRYKDVASALRQLMGASREAGVRMK